VRLELLALVIFEYCIVPGRVADLSQLTQPPILSTAKFEMLIVLCLCALRLELELGVVLGHSLCTTHNSAASRQQEIGEALSSVCVWYMLDGTFNLNLHYFYGASQ
jgi:hypothetical protein